jgi:LacI family transcriptional regulator
MAYLGQNNVHAGRIAAEHLIAVHGHRRLWYLGGPRDASAREDRIDGIRSVVKEHPGVTLAGVHWGPTTVESGIDLARVAQESGAQSDDGFICHHDVIAYGFIHSWRATSGTRHVSAIGYGDISESVAFDPPLTSVGVGPPSFGERTAERVLELLAGGSPYSELMEPKLQVRASCGCRF